MNIDRIPPANVELDLPQLAATPLNLARIRSRAELECFTRLLVAQKQYSHVIEVAQGHWIFQPGPPPPKREGRPVADLTGGR